MGYIVYKASNEYSQITYDSLISGEGGQLLWTNRKNYTITRKIDNNLLPTPDYPAIYNQMQKLRKTTAGYYGCDMSKHYWHYEIPKKTGGTRPIDEPTDRLKAAQYSFIRCFNKFFGDLHHTNAYGYLKDRCVIDVAKKHKDSEWFLKIDISDFFGSTDPGTAITQIAKVYPFCKLYKYAEGKSWLNTTLYALFLNNGLPQGAPTSPMLTNLIMIPFDYEITKILSEMNLTYTRYSDDMQISGKYMFDWRKVVEAIRETFREHGYPYVIKDSKTHFGNVKGRNWMLGTKINAEHKVSVGWENHKVFKAKCHKLIMDFKNGEKWKPNDVQVLRGVMNWYACVEPTYVERIKSYYIQKFGEIEGDIDHVLKAMESLN